MQPWIASLLTCLCLVSTSACSSILYLVANTESTYAAALGDLDGDGDLDAVLANGANEGRYPDTVWINQGGRQANSSGSFINSGQSLSNAYTAALDLGDLDGDDDLDVLAGGIGSLQIYINQGGVQNGRAGALVEQGQAIYIEHAGGLWEPHLGDLDGDGDLDAYVASCCGGIMSSDQTTSLLPASDLIYFNDGSGGFSDSGQRLGMQGTEAAALGDLDGDGDLDVYTANASAVIEPNGKDERDQPDRVWLNDGSGHFTDSGQRLGRSSSRGVALGDLDGDGDLDAFTAARGPALAWLNDGSGNFSDSGQRLGDLAADNLLLGDLDGDGDLDALVYSEEECEVWNNDGGGAFQLSGQRLEFLRHYGAALGDLDGDGDLDLFAGYLDKRYQVWWNDGFGRLGNRWR